MEAIASALEFLRRETAALGLHEVSDMIGSVRVRIRSHNFAARGPDHLREDLGCRRTDG